MNQIMKVILELGENYHKVAVKCTHKKQNGFIKY